jgi:hypothetical protein
MITAQESDYIKTHAYIPEHITDYVKSVSEAEPYLFGNYLCYRKDATLIFIGYPLGEAFDEKTMNTMLGNAAKRFKSQSIALIAKTISQNGLTIIKQSSDDYYKLNIHDFSIPQKVENMVKRASKELTIEKVQECKDEHRKLIEEFLSYHEVSKDIEYIFKRIPHYISSSKTVWVVNARDANGELNAFDVMDLGSKEYAFYMFNVVSKIHYVPGVSDLLFHNLVSTAREEGKRCINLGLGINEGVRFFKKKWGGIPFLHYEFCLYEHQHKNIVEMLLQNM